MRSLALLPAGALALCGTLLVAQAGLAQSPRLGFVNKLGQDLDVRSGARILADDVLSGKVILPGPAPSVPAGTTVPQIQLRGGNTQANDPTLDYVQIFAGSRPFVRATQGETSMAVFGRNIVATYNNSAGIHVSLNPSGPGLIVDRVQLSGYSVSNDDGQTWASGSMPPAAGASSTFGDPSIGVDRHGDFYFANLGADANLEADGLGHATIQVNKSVDGGNTWSSAVVVQSDDAADKDWLTVGPDPVVKNRDNVYVTWTSFQPAACELRF
jgi:hypothetical protein